MTTTNEPAARQRVLTVKLVYLVVLVGGLAGGSVAHALGNATVADVLWAATSAAGLALLCASVIEALLHRR